MLDRIVNALRADEARSWTNFRIDGLRSYEQADAIGLAHAWFKAYIEGTNEDFKYTSEEETFDEALRWFRRARDHQKEIDALQQQRDQLTTLGLGSLVRGFCRRLIPI